MTLVSQDSSWLEEISLRKNGIYCTDTGVAQKFEEKEPQAAGKLWALLGTSIRSLSHLFIYPLGVRMFAGIIVSGRVLLGD